ncbi:MAG: T9SS type B sorting domain-containing protein [Flavobacteriales bacterium]
MSRIQFFTSLILACTWASLAHGQLDTIHWIPPLHSRDAQQINDHYLYISTPSIAPVEVVIRDGSGAIFGDSPYSVWNGNPLEVYIADGQTSGSKLMVAQSELNMTLSNRGLVISASEPIFCNARYRSFYQAEALTGKGTSARGKTFRYGAMPNWTQQNLRSFVLGIMATDNSAQVQISGYDPNVIFAGLSAVNDDVLSFLLSPGESRVYSGYANSNSNLAGMIGALIQSSGDIVVNVGNWCGSVGTGSGQDIGVDQIIPIGFLGTDHILVEGIGDPTQERGLVVAHYPNTEVRLNGSITPAAVLQPGEWYMTNNSDYTGTPHANMFIQVSEPAYVYQFLAGSSSQSTPGLNFIPPISCGMPFEVNEIPSVQSIGSTNYSGGIFAITEEGANLTIDGASQFGAVAVDGYPGWETYRILNLTGDITVESTGPLAVGLFGSSADAGFSGYYSGFSLNTSANFTASSEVCWGDDAILEFNGDTIDGGTLIWDFGTLDVEEMGDDAFLADTPFPGDYVVSLFVASEQCSDSSSQTITFFPPYEGESTANACGSYLWNGDALTSSGVYYDTLTSITGCDSLVQLNLEIMGMPDPLMADWSTDTAVYCPAPGTLLFGMASDDVYQNDWTYTPFGFSETIPLASYNSTAEYVGPGIYEITYATGPPCNLSATGIMAVELEDCNVTIPNVFSPNGDGENERFVVEGLHNLDGVRIRIFNRWGKLMFLENNFGSSAGWDPRQNASEGTYFYVLEIPLLSSELTITSLEGTETKTGPQTILYQGSITLVR